MTPIACIASALCDVVDKGFNSGTHRTRSPENTVASLRPILPVMGITRVADITGLDRIGIPVVVVCRPNSRSLSVSQGKGIDLASAKASALMESIEAYHAEHITLPLKLGSYDDLRYTHRMPDVWSLPRPSTSLFDDHASLLWIEGVDLVHDEGVWVPYELVHTNYTLPHPTGHGCFTPSSNGLASGNHILEAISHGICEVVERDATTLWYLLDEEERARTRVALDSVSGPYSRGILEKFQRAGLAVAVWDTTSDVALPSFLCIIVEPRGELHSAAGMGCHPSRDVALVRALTEAAQSRLTIISGSRDDIFRGDYERSCNPDVLRRDLSLTEAGMECRAFTDIVDFSGETLNDDVAWELRSLRTAHCDSVIAVDLTKPEFRLPVVRILIPKLEGPSSVVNWQPGPRAKARMLRSQ